MNMNLMVEAELEMPEGSVLFAAGNGLFEYNTASNWAQVSNMQVNAMKKFESAGDMEGQDIDPMELDPSVLEKILKELLSRAFEDGEAHIRKAGMLK